MDIKFMSELSERIEELEEKERCFDILRNKACTLAEQWPNEIVAQYGLIYSLLTELAERRKGEKAVSDRICYCGCDVLEHTSRFCRTCKTCEGFQSQTELKVAVGSTLCHCGHSPLDHLGRFCCICGWCEGVWSQTKPKEPDERQVHDFICNKCGSSFGDLTQMNSHYSGECIEMARNEWWSGLTEANNEEECFKCCPKCRLGFSAKDIDYHYSGECVEIARDEWWDGLWSQTEPKTDTQQQQARKARWFSILTLQKDATLYKVFCDKCGSSSIYWRVTDVPIQTWIECHYSGKCVEAVQPARELSPDDKRAV